jgi:glycosyltransferase involved in cell wall biosynthesis
MRITIIIPVHNEEAIIESAVHRVMNCSLLQEFSQVNLILVENGSADNSKQVVAAIAAQGARLNSRGWLIGVTEPNAGIGYAYARGAYEGLQRGVTSAEDWYLWTACDLPFGFSDLESFTQIPRGGIEAPIVIGSKAHRGSRIQRGYVTLHRKTNI